MDRLAPTRARTFAGPAADASTATGRRYRATMFLAVATCVLVPAYTIRWHLGPLPTTILENAILLTFAAFVLESIRESVRPIWHTRVTLPVLVFLIAGAISVFVAPDHRAAVGLYRAYFVEPIGFGLVLVNAVTTPRRALLIALGLALGSVVAGLANSAVVVNALLHHAYDVVQTPPVVIYNTANAVALYLVPLVAFAGAVLLHWPGRIERTVAGAFVAVGVVCVLLSFSRGGYLALPAVAIVSATFARAWRGWHNSDVYWRTVHLGVLLALLAVVVHGLVDVPYFKNDLSLEFWALLSLTFAVGAGSLSSAHAAAATQTSSPSKTAAP